MIIVGLTGSIGMGKSFVAALFEEKGVPVFDADRAVRRSQEPGGAAIAPLKKAFPDTVKDGVLDRNLLARRVFASPEAKQQLEAIMHPLVNDARKAFFHEAARRGEKIVVLDVPLLFETGLSERCDYIVVVSAPKDIQRRRVMQRAGMTEERFKKIDAHQMPDEDKRAQADYVINTHAEKVEIQKEVEKVLSRVKDRGAMAYEKYWEKE